MYTHIKHTIHAGLQRLKSVHSTGLKAVFLALGMATLLTIHSDVPYEGHFLQRTALQKTTVKPVAKVLPKKKQRSSSSRRASYPTRAARVAILDSAIDHVPARVSMSERSSSSMQRAIKKNIDPVMRRAAPEIDARTTAPSSSSTQPVVNVAATTFPAFGRTVQPVSTVPNWGAMTKPEQWNRSYKELSSEDFVRVPPYDMNTLTIPMVDLLKDRFNPETIRVLTAKLYYSTRFFGKYDIDATEFTAVHPGIDLKLAEGTPIGAIAGGRVHAIRNDEESLGIFAIIEHHAPDGETYYSIYGHMDKALVQAGDDVSPGQTIGLVGMTGHTTGPHIHLQVDRGTVNEQFHEVYWPLSAVSHEEAAKHTVNPIEFIRQFADGE